MRAPLCQRLERQRPQPQGSTVIVLVGLVVLAGMVLAVSMWSRVESPILILTHPALAIQPSANWGSQTLPEITNYNTWYQTTPAVALAKDPASSSEDASCTLQLYLPACEGQGQSCLEGKLPDLAAFAGGPWRFRVYDEDASSFIFNADFETLLPGHAEADSGAGHFVDLALGQTSQNLCFGFNVYDDYSTPQFVGVELQTIVLCYPSAEAWTPSQLTCIARCGIPAPKPHRRLREEPLGKAGGSLLCYDPKEHISTPRKEGTKMIPADKIHDYLAALTKAIEELEVILADIPPEEA